MSKNITKGRIMMRIAICDSDIKCAQKTKNMIYDYANKRRLELLVEIYDSSEALLESENNYLLIILDYHINGLNGLETAKQLRRKNCRSTIMFLSEYTGFIFESFKVMPHSFLLKPLGKKCFFAVLDDFFLYNPLHRPLWVKSGDDVFCFETHDIFYLEADNKNCFIGLRNGKVRCKKTMARVYGNLPKTHFGKINRAYVVNFNYITGYNNECISLVNGKTLHISRNYYKSFKDEYKSFADPHVI